MRIAWISTAALLSFAMTAAAAVVKVSTADGLRNALGTAKSADSVVVAGGTYFLDKPLVIGPAQSGVTIEAADGATPVISGGVRISGWHAASFNGRDCWAADLPDVKSGSWYFRELWVDGRRAVRRRTPNSGSYFKIKESPDATDDWQTGQSRFVFDGADVPAGPFAFGAEAVVMCKWVESRLPLKSVDAEHHVASFARTSRFRLDAGDPYWIEGDPRSFDAPGEFYLDRTSGTLYYLPRAGEVMEQVDAIAPRLSQVLRVVGSPAEKKFVEKLTVRGITFSHTEWMLPEVDPATSKPTESGFGQAAVGVVPTIEAVGLRASSFDRCTVEHIGNYALQIGQGCSRDVISRCTIRDFGAGGIRVGEMEISQKPEELCFGNWISDCSIYDGGWVFPSAVGIIVFQSFDNLIAHNHIHDLFYSGISTGWSWGYGDSLNRGNIVEKNLVNHIGKKADGDGPILSDMGAVYLLGARGGSVIRNNVFHDIAGIKYGGWGIYLDEGSSDVLVENNLVYRTTEGGFHLHYGKGSTVRNNIFAFARKWQIQRTREEDHVGFTFEHNVVYWNEGPLTNTTPGNARFDYNFYGPVREADLRTAMISFAQWRAAGQDVHSVVGDAGFVDPAHGDFRLKDAGAVKAVGFSPFDVSDVGPREDAPRGRGG